MLSYLRKTEPLAWPFVVCLVAACCSVFTQNQVDPDLWGHVRYGADMLQQQQVFDTDPYSYLSRGFPWFNHELLCELTLGFLEPRFGATSLIVWKWLMGIVTLSCIVWAHRNNRLKSVSIVLIAVLVLLNIRMGWVVRPQVFTYMFLSLFALLMIEHDRGRPWVLWLAPPVMVIWTNSHGGFLVGLCILGIHVLFSLGRILLRREAGWLRQIGSLSLVLLVTTIAPMVSPYGLGLLNWLWDALTVPRPEITEWRPVPFWNMEFASFKLLILISLGSIMATRRTRNWCQVAILALVGWQAFLHMRHVPLFAILAAYYVPEHLDDCVRRIRSWMVHRGGFSKANTSLQCKYRIALIAVTLLFGVVCILQLRTIVVDRGVYPVSAFRYIEDRSLHGRMVTEFNWGQYCLYTFWPRILISVDGRFRTAYPREVLDINLDFALGDHPKRRLRSPTTGEFKADRILDLENPTLALVSRKRNTPTQTLMQRTDWVLLYQDSLAQIWGRRSVYGDPRSQDYIPPSERLISDAAQTGFISFPATPVEPIPHVTPNT